MTNLLTFFLDSFVSYSVDAVIVRNLVSTMPFTAFPIEAIEAIEAIEYPLTLHILPLHCISNSNIKMTMS